MAQQTTALHQLLAVRDTIKNSTNTTITGIYHQLQKPDAFDGLIRTYRPYAEDGTPLPGERKMVQRRVPDLVANAEDAWVKLIDLTAAVDLANTAASADIVIDGRVLVAAVPATTLLWLEKQLADVIALWRKVPVLSPDREWSFNEALGVHQAAALVTVRSEKRQEPLVLYPATDKHPAQTQLMTTDVPAGEWTAVAQSGAMPMNVVAAQLGKLEKLVIAVKTAREKANQQPVSNVTIGAQIFDYLH